MDVRTAVAGSRWLLSYRR